MSLIKDKILYPIKDMPIDKSALPKFEGNFGEEIIKGFSKIIQKDGDFDWLINGPYDLTNKTSTCGLKKRKASELEPEAKKAAAAFYSNGLRKGDVVHFLIPNSTENHIIAVGAWLCEAIVSLVDPETSVKVLTTQLQDTKAKMIICSNHSRKVVFETLKCLDLLGKVKVIVLELAQPKLEQDIPIGVDEKNFVFYEDFLNNDGQIQPPSLQNGPLKDEEVFIIFWSSGTTGNPKGKKILFEEWYLGTL
jgi:long-subunit acyl-CoA synthetase (AMP-forming)